MSARNILFPYITCHKRTCWLRKHSHDVDDDVVWMIEVERASGIHSRQLNYVHGSWCCWRFLVGVRIRKQQFREFSFKTPCVTYFKFSSKKIDGKFMFVGKLFFFFFNRKRRKSTREKWKINMKL